MVKKYEWEAYGKKFMNVTCDCGGDMEEYTHPRMVSVYVCLKRFNWEKQTGKFFCDLE